MQEITKKVYQLESSGGKHDSCRASGLFNGYGFRQNKAEWKCYQTQKEVEQLVNDWFKEHLETKTLAQSLCHYNTGSASNDCPYYQKFLSLE